LTLVCTLWNSPGSQRPESGNSNILKKYSFGGSKVGKCRLTILTPVLGRSAEALVKGRVWQTLGQRCSAQLWCQRLCLYKASWSPFKTAASMLKGWSSLLKLCTDISKRQTLCKGFGDIAGARGKIIAWMSSWLKDKQRSVFVRGKEW